jgi:hypothetical protein
LPTRRKPTPLVRVPAREQTTKVSLSKRELAIALWKLAKEDTPDANRLYTKLISSWDGLWGPGRTDRRYCRACLSAAEFETFQCLEMPGMVESNYVAIFSDTDPDSPTFEQEVRVHSITRPPRRKVFKIAGGKVRLNRTSIRTITRTELENIMARKAAKTVTPDIDDDLDGLDELDDIDDEDEAPAPKAKKESAAAKRKRLAAEAAADDDDDEDEDDEDEDEDEDDEPAETPKQKRTRLRKEAAAAAAKPKKKTGNRTPPPQRELPDGRVGPTELATLIGGKATARDVRVFLRKHAVAKNEDLGRYAFTPAQAEKLAKKFKAAAAK